MKFSCKRTEIEKILVGVRRAIPTKSPLTVLEGFLIQATEKNLKITGYNMEFAISAECPAIVEKTGAVVINAKLLTEIIKKLPSEAVIVEVDDQLTMHIVCENSTFNIVGLEATDFPEIPTIDNDLTLAIQCDAIKSMIEQTIYAVSTDTERIVHTGILVTLTQKVLKLVAIDGYRMALRQENIDSDIEFRCIVPAKVLGELMKLLPISDDEKNCDNTTKICVSNSHILFNVDSFTIVSRLLSGEFADYEKILKQEVRTTVSVSVDEMIRCFERVALVINERINMCVRCAFEDNFVTFLCNTAIGTAKDSLNCEFTGEKITIGFNHKFITDALKNSQCDRVLLEFDNNLKPVKITSSENPNFVFVVLPVRLQE